MKLTLNLILLFSSGAFCSSISRTSVLNSNREYDPVVLTGAELPELIGATIPSIVAFEHRPSSNLDENWIQIPLQIDERHLQNWENIKNGDCRILGRKAVDLMYADPNTYSGPDEDPNFDSDDELVFMARHLGKTRVGKSTPMPQNVKKESIVEIRVSDPEEFGQILGYVYLFISEEDSKGMPKLQQAAGQKLVNYTFTLSTVDPNSGSNNYFDVYKFACEFPKDIHECNDEVANMNPEDSWIKSAHYSRHFAQNWHSDEARITTDGSNGEDFWGMEDFQFLLFDCSRCVRSFMKSPTAFVANIDGPVRAIRSWVGANSGAITHREAKYYEQREDQTTFVRVHTVPGMFDVINFEAQVPLTFFNCHNKDGFLIDGKMSSEEENNFDQRYCPWEMVTGASGTFLRVIDVVHDLGDWFGYEDINANDFMRSWYYDNAIPSSLGDSGAPEHPNKWSLCSATVDNQTEAWGTMGFKLKDFLFLIPNTDPTRYHLWENLPEGACEIETAEPWLYHLLVSTNQYYLSPDLPTSKAEELHSTSFSPLYRFT